MILFLFFFNNLSFICLKNLFYSSMDLWDSNTMLTSSQRSSIVGLSYVGQICTSYKYSIIEEEGFNNMQNAAHELGHK